MTDDDAEPVAQLESVGLRYRKRVALDDVSLNVPSGRMAGLIGPDGVGKSSLLSLIAGVRRIQDGSVHVLGGDMADARHRHEVCARIAYMPQGLGRNLYPTLSVVENLDFFARLFGQARSEREARIADLLEATGLAPFPDRPVGQLSGGMKQKLGLCCALIHDPDLLILDEPTTGVDPLSRRQFWQLIDRLRDRRPGMSVLVATAYMEEAEGFDWLAAMDGGRVLARGTPRQLKSDLGVPSLEQAFVALLPEEKRRGYRQVATPPRMSHGDTAAIEAQGLTKRFDGFTAVDHVSFRIERGEIFGFLGSNGCGKTTTMKMLTGLLPASEGEAWLFGHAVDPRDIETRKRVGFMSQAFSLYGELTVRQNLDLHARLFHLPRERIAGRVAEMIERFELADVADELSERLPLGIRQRLSLAVAVIHGPEMLILDEPTSGVDPVARDRFWELLIRLSRDDGVTIFISTHFMNEAERCDRISLMHAGRVLAQGPPRELVRDRGAADLEQAFISHLEEAAPDLQAGTEEAPAAAGRPAETMAPSAARGGHTSGIAGRVFSPRRFWAFARREAMEVRRDGIRLAFSLLGPVFLLIVCSYGISFDVENLRYAVLDYDRSPDSRSYLENFAGSRYFEQTADVGNVTEMDRRLVRGDFKLAIEIPTDYGRDLRAGDAPEVAVWLDGSFTAETARGYVRGIHQRHLRDLELEGLAAPPPRAPVEIETRFRYNQDFDSIYAMVPGSIMLLLVMIPAMMTAVGVVREKELGSITNLHATPASRLEFLLGKQLPYVGLALANFFSFLLLSLVLFRVPVEGSLPALLFGVVVYVIATTGFGLMFSSFLRSQIAAIFATAIVTVIPTINFSGLLTPAASLTGVARVMGELFPATYFHRISVGTFTKALGFGDLIGEFAALTAFALVFLGLGVALLKSQEG